MVDQATTKPENDVEITLEKIRPNKKLYRKEMLLTSAVYAGFGIAGTLTWNIVPFSAGPLEFNLGLPFLLLPFIHGIASFIGGTVRTDEHVVLYSYGVPLKVAKAGLSFASAGLMNRDRLPADTQEIHEPGRRDDIFWGDEKEELPRGKVRPIWMPTRAPEDAEKQPLDAQMSVGVVYAVFWRIKDPITFRAHMRSVAEASQQLKVMSTAVLAEDIAQGTASAAIANRAKLNAHLDDHIRRETDDWGIEITKAFIIDLNLSHKLGSAMRDRAAARFQAETVEIEAQGKAKAIELVGEADGKAARARTRGPIDGRADGYKALMETLNVDGETILAAEATEKVADGGNVILAGGGSGTVDLLGMVTAGAAALKAVDTAKKKEEAA